MSQVTESYSVPKYSTKNINDFANYHDNESLSNCSSNGSLDVKDSIRSLVAPYCNRKFENLQEYLLEVAKALGQRQCFYSLDLADILKKIQKWKNMLPNVDIFYAVKANSDPLLLKLLVKIGASFDCATEGEIQSVLKAGASPKSILWAHTVKPDEGLRYAQSVGVDAMVYDDEEELRKIHRVFPSARLLLRVCPSKVVCKYDLSSKFGCSRFKAEHLLRLAKQLEMNVIGISFHVGALCTDPDCFSLTIQDCREIFRKAQQIGYELSVLDMGGGFFGASGTESIFSEITQGINQALKEHFSDIKVHVIAEPGCYLVNSAFNIVCTVLGKRTVEDTDGVCKQYFVNDSIYGSFYKNIEYYGIRTKFLLDEAELTKRPVFRSVLFGQTCCSEDVISGNCRLPELYTGERILWQNMGAYCTATFSNFCGVPFPATVYVFDQSEGSIPCDYPMNNTLLEFLRQHAVVIGRGDITA